MNLETDRNISAIAEGIGATAKRVTLGVVIGASLLALSFCAGAQAPHFVDGKSLSRACQAKTNTDASLCAGFLLGVIDAGNGVHYCLPSGTKTSEVVEPLAGFFKNLPPEAETEAANEIIISILKLRAPCDRSPPTAPRAPRNGGLT